MQKYPIGIQDFKEIIDGGYVYVDKTKYIYDLVTLGKPYFLSRPRRFGKSLLISTLNELFTGKKELFESTFIYHKWDWTQTNPVIRIDFNAIGVKEKGLQAALNDALDQLFSDFHIDLIENSLSQKFDYLISSVASKGSRVVILIDEYDKPIIDYLGEDDSIAEENKSILKNFYSVLKSADSHIRMLFITGVSKFSKVSIFSDLNHLNDISVDRNYGGICGITEEELQSYFPTEIKELDADKIKEWYNGYTWDRQVRVYNPFSLLNFFSKKEFSNFWYQSGHPAFLGKLLKKEDVYDIENFQAKISSLDSVSIEHLDYKVLLYQTGYLTFGEEVEPGYYQMQFPNREVEDSFNEFLWRVYREKPSQEPSSILISLKNAFKVQDFSTIQEQLNILFASLPYDFMKKEKEVIFHAIIHLTFKLLGEFVLSEVHTHKGRCDALVICDNAIYCFEFKLGKSAKEALEQIYSRGYLASFKGKGKKLFAIGVNYSKEGKEIDEFEWEEV